MKAWRVLSASVVSCVPMERKRAELRNYIEFVMVKLPKTRRTPVFDRERVDVVPKRIKQSSGHAKGPDRPLGVSACIHDRTVALVWVRGRCSRLET